MESETSHPEESLPLAVQVQGLSKGYGRSLSVFQDVHLQVPKGKIFALLGPSGCGKTTLLRCILGRVQPDSGSILIFGHPTRTEKSGVPGPNVGYMPQEKCIYETMTIGECLRYYGRLAGMIDRQITYVTDHILDILKLPSQSDMICNLSGGQQRRVAFAISLLHEPKLLILDEPTVGIDPIMKDRMWRHLLKLTRNNGTTIVITTHYIEEARTADKVGLMHGKTMVEEEYTDRLLTKYRCQTLEEVFLKICHGNRPTSCENEVVASGCPGDSVAPMVEAAVVKSTFLPQLKDLRARPRVVWAIFVKNFINIYRFPGAFIFLMLLPLIQVLGVFYGVSGVIHNLSMAVVNEDAGHLGQTFLNHLDPWMVRLVHSFIYLGLVITDDANCAEDSKSVLKIPYATFEDGLRATREGKTYGVIGIGQNFSEAFHSRLLDGLLQDADIFGQSIISVALDDSHYIICGLAKYHILDAFQQFQNSVVRNSTTTNPMMAELVVQFDQKTVKNFKAANTFVLLLGTVVNTCFSAPVAIAVCALYVERMKGLLERTFMTGVSAAEIILGLVAFLLLVLVVQISVVMIPIVWTLESIKTGSTILVALVIFLVGVAGTTLGLAASLLVDQLSILMVAGGFLVILASAFDGHLWPIEALPFVAKVFYLASPVACPTQALIAVVHHGWDLRHAVVRWGCFSSVLWSIILGTVALVLLKMKM